MDPVLPPYFTDNSHCLPHRVLKYPDILTVVIRRSLLGVLKQLRSVRSSGMYSKKSSVRASHLPAAFCAFRSFLLVPFTALFFSIVFSAFFVKVKS